MAADSATTRSAGPALVVLPQASNLVPTPVRGSRPTSYGLTSLSGERNLGSPLREIRTAGSERGDGFQEFNLKAHPYPPLALIPLCGTRAALSMTALEFLDKLQDCGNPTGPTVKSAIAQTPAFWIKEHA